MTSPVEFIEGWNIIETLGEGAYGEVKLLIHVETSNTVAVKIVDLKRHRDAYDCVKKEERIHRLLVHPHIIRMLGKREELDKVYIFLEYASAGELFNRIEPDVGMSSGEAQSYMKQLLSGVQYLHSKGVAHRDLKPENILLDENLNLKISDFGLATVFRLRGKERLLEKKCGTLPYVAPEVLQNPYHAEAADLWSCGIILVAMLAGELPWDEPTEKSPEFVKWRKESGLVTTPWSKLETAALGLARKILAPSPSDRPKIEQILLHPWMKTNFHYSRLDESAKDSIEPPTKRLSFASKDSSASENTSVALSQPTPNFTSPLPDLLVPLLQVRARPKSICFSQPTNNEDLMLGSQIQFTQGPVTQSNFQRLVKRMTRFFVNTNYEETVNILCSALDSLHYSWNSSGSGVITISTMDGRKMKLVFKANLISMNNKLLLDFRLSKGCGLEFKKRFIKVQVMLSHIVSNQ